MNKIIDTFKSFYKGENVVKTHISIALLFIIPCLMGATAGYLDKDTKELLLPLGIMLGIFLILSIIPLLTLTGYCVQFLHDRYTNKQGLPKFNKESLYCGLKVLPISIAKSI